MNVPMLTPEWRVLVVAVPLVAWMLFELVAGRRSGDRTRREHALAWSRTVVAIALLGVGLRPTATDRVEVPVPGNTDLVLLVDRTASMGALDAAGGRSRIEAVGDDLAALVSGTSGANVSVVVFDDDARVAVPSTTDATAVSAYLRTMGWLPSAKATGSDISVALDVTRELLDASVEAEPGRNRYVVYVGDGEQTQDGEPASFAPLADLVDGSLVLGYGTRAGGVMPVAPGESETVELDGEVQRSRIDEGHLRAIAADLGGDYLHRATSGDLPEFGRAATGSATELRPGEEYHWWLALAAFPFLLHLLWVAVTELRQVRRER